MLKNAAPRAYYVTCTVAFALMTSFQEALDFLQVSALFWITVTFLCIAVLAATLCSVIVFSLLTGEIVLTWRLRSNEQETKHKPT